MPATSYTSAICRFSDLVILRFANFAVPGTAIWRFSDLKLRGARHCDLAILRFAFAVPGTAIWRFSDLKLRGARHCDLAILRFETSRCQALRFGDSQI